MTFASLYYNRTTEKGKAHNTRRTESLLGLECEYYKTGNVHHAYWRGGEMSNCDARRVLAASIWYDLKTDKIYMKNPPKYYKEELFEAAREFFA